MQASQAPRPSYSYTNFYKDCALYPEQPKFRRFAAYWAKKLYDDTEELVKGEKELSNAIAGFRESRGQGPLSVLDCPRSLIQGNDGLKKQWSDFEQLLRTYSKQYKPHDPADIALTSTSAGPLPVPAIIQVGRSCSVLQQTHERVFESISEWRLRPHG